MPKLVYHRGLPDESIYDVAIGSFTIGRGPECDIHIRDKSLSRRHAQVEVTRGHAQLVDLNSKNGTFVNGVRVERHLLSGGDFIKLGEIDLRFLDGDPPSVPGGDPTPVGVPQGGFDGAGSAPQPLAEGYGAPRLVVSVTRLSMDDLLAAGTAGGALKVRPADGERRARDKLQVLLAISQLLSSPTDPDALLHKILDLVFQTLDVDRGAMLLVDPASGELTPRAVKSLRHGGDGGPIFSQRIVNYVREKSVAALFGDAVFDPRLASSESIVFQSIRASMCAPLKPKNEVIGVLYVDNLSVPNRFSEEDLEFLSAFANQAAIAIENAALYRRIEAESINRMQLIMQEKVASLANVVAGIAHEIRNPLNFIKNFAEISVGLADEVTEGLTALGAGGAPAGLADLAATLADLRGSVAKIEEHGGRINDIIHRMLLHARSSSGAREEADLHAVLDESVLVVQRVLSGQQRGFDLRVVTDFDRSVGAVEMVTADISRVFVNVIDNACYAMRQKSLLAITGYVPALTLSTRASGGSVEVRIRDNGPGLRAEIADKIFNPFFTTKPPGQGTGLGLSLSHEIIVQGHRGEMRVTSEPGAFTEVVIVLPRRAPRPTLTSSAPSSLDD